jgi:hypothetical protein
MTNLVFEESSGTVFLFHRQGLGLGAAIGTRGRDWD